MPFASFSHTFASERSSPSDKGQMLFSGNFSLKSDRRLKLSASEKHLSSLTSPIHRSTVFLLTATQCSLRRARPKQKAAVFQAQALTPTTLHVKKCVSEGAGGSTQAADGTPSSARPLPPQHHHLAARSAGANSAQRRRLRLSLRVSRSCPRGRRPPALSALCCLGVCPSIRPSVRVRKAGPHSPRRLLPSGSRGVERRRAQGGDEHPSGRSSVRFCGFRACF